MPLIEYYYFYTNIMTPSLCWTLASLADQLALKSLCLLLLLGYSVSLLVMSLNSYFLRDEGHNQHVGARALQNAAKPHWLYFGAIRDSALPRGPRCGERSREHPEPITKEARKCIYVR